MAELAVLFFTFCKIGLFTFGGGYTMLPMLEREVVQRHGWASQEELLDYFAIGQCTPGLIAVNTATLIGYRKRGVLGGIVAALGVVLPSFITLLIIAALLTGVINTPFVISAFKGIRVAVCALILNTVIKLIRNNIKSVLQFVLLAIAFVCTAIADISPILTIIGATLLGIVLGRKGLIK